MNRHLGSSFVMFMLNILLLRLGSNDLGHLEGLQKLHREAQDSDLA